MSQSYISSFKPRPHFEDVIKNKDKSRLKFPPRAYIMRNSLYYQNMDGMPDPEKVKREEQMKGMESNLKTIGQDIGLTFSELRDVMKSVSGAGLPPELKNALDRSRQAALRQEAEHAREEQMNAVADQLKARKDTLMQRKVFNILENKLKEKNAKDMELKQTMFDKLRDRTAYGKWKNGMYDALAEDTYDRKLKGKAFDRINANMQKNRENKVFEDLYKDAKATFNRQDANRTAQSYVKDLLNRTQKTNYFNVSPRNLSIVSDPQASSSSSAPIIHPVVPAAAPKGRPRKDDPQAPTRIQPARAAKQNK